MEENNKDENVVAETTQNFDIVKTIDDFKINEAASENIASSLAGNVAAKLAGSFTATTAGKKKLTATFNYTEEGDAVTAVAETEVIAVKLAIELVRPKLFPTALPKNFAQEVEFLIKHSNSFAGTTAEAELKGLAATGITIEGLEGLSEISISEETLKNEVVTGSLDVEPFKQKNSTIQLELLHQFRLKATFKMGEDQTILSILVKYAELEFLDKSDLDKVGAKFEQTINLQAIEVVGTVATALPAKIKLGSVHELVFQFTNKDTEFPATGVNITIAEQSADADALVADHAHDG